MALLEIAGYTVSLAQAEDDQLIAVWLLDETTLDPETGITTPTIEISLNGAAFATPDDGTFTEISDGLYTVRLNAVDTVDAGILILRVIKSGTTRESVVYCDIGISPVELRSDYIRTRRMSV